VYAGNERSMEGGGKRGTDGWETRQRYSDRGDKKMRVRLEVKYIHLPIATIYNVILALWPIEA
jgi:hypothetical protein